MKSAQEPACNNDNIETTAAPAKAAAPIPAASRSSTTETCTLASSSGLSKPLPHRSRILALMLGALAVTVGIDRLVLTSEPHTIVLHIAIFWMVCLAASIALFLRSAFRQPMWWFLAAALLALLIRTLTFPDSPGDANSYYQFLTLSLFAPALLMLQLQLGTGLLEPYHPSSSVIRWFGGWFVDPFSYLPRFVAALQTVATSKTDDAEHSPGATGHNTAGKGTTGHDVVPASRQLAQKIAIATLIAVPVLAVLANLLYSSDLVFAYFVRHAIGDIDLTAAIRHLLVIATPIPFLFSLLANINRRADTRLTERSRQSAAPAQEPIQRNEIFDVVIVEIVLGAVLALYLAFSVVQFTFLFARQGLPNGYTYAQYAREGFFQLLLVACINLVSFGIVLLCCRRTKTVLGMQIALLAATVVLLASSATRLRLYINVYGLTWLRFASMAFIVLLTVMLILCIVRLFVARVPLLVVCFIVFVAWYLALGLMNPSGFIAAYNSGHGLS